MTRPPPISDAQLRLLQNVAAHQQASHPRDDYDPSRMEWRSVHNLRDQGLLDVVDHGVSRRTVERGTWGSRELYAETVSKREYRVRVTPAGWQYLAERGL